MLFLHDYTEANDEKSACVIKVYQRIQTKKYADNFASSGGGGGQKKTTNYIFLPAIFT